MQVCARSHTPLFSRIESIRLFFVFVIFLPSVLWRKRCAKRLGHSWSALSPLALCMRPSSVHSLIDCDILSSYYKLHSAVSGNTITPPSPHFYPSLVPCRWLSTSSLAPYACDFLNSDLAFADEAKKGSQYCQRVRFNLPCSVLFQHRFDLFVFFFVVFDLALVIVAFDAAGHFSFNRHLFPSSAVVVDYLASLSAAVFLGLIYFLPFVLSCRCCFFACDCYLVSTAIYRRPHAPCQNCFLAPRM